VSSKAATLGRRRFFDRDPTLCDPRMVLMVLLIAQFFDCSVFGLVTVGKSLCHLGPCALVRGLIERSAAAKRFGIEVWP
jgi:hypothetical protein